MADTIKTNLGPVTAYADAKAHGYTGTREEFGQLLANAGLNLKAAETAKADAEAAKQAAETAQQAAAENQKNAGTQAANAKASADTAAEQAAVAEESAADAANSATAAQESETNAGLSATAAANAEAAAKQAQNAAETAKADAETAKTAAGNSADAAANSAADAKKTLESIPADYSTLSGKVTENTSGISKLEEDLSNKITKFYASNQGETHITDSDNGKIQDMMLYGKSSQDGAPTPENPVEIKSVVNPTVKIVGKNLLKATLQTATKNGVTYTANGDGTYTLNGTATSTTELWMIGRYDNNIKIPLNPTKTYVLKGTGTSNIQVHAGTSDHILVSGDGKDIVLSNMAGLAFVLIRVNSGVTVNNLTLHLQLEEGLATTAYEPYHEQTVTLPYTLNAIPALSGGNVTIDGQQYVADYVDVERGKLVKMVDSSKLDNTQSIVNKTEWLLAEPQEIDLTQEEVQTLKTFATYYPTTNIFINSEQLDGYTVFNYPISMANGWNYVKKQLNDNRDYIYDMDTRTQDMDIQSAEAYVNSEYAVALTELEI